MPKTLAQLNKEIAALQKQAETMKRQEIDGVVARIKEAIAAYDLSPADLGFSGTSKQKTGKRRAAKASKSGTVKFRDEAGHTWSGHGRRPQWYLDAIAGGKTPEQLMA